MTIATLNTIQDLLKREVQEAKQTHDEVNKLLCEFEQEGACETLIKGQSEAEEKARLKYCSLLIAYEDFTHHKW